MEKWKLYFLKSIEKFPNFRNFAKLFFGPKKSKKNRVFFFVCFCVFFPRRLRRLGMFGAFGDFGALFFKKKKKKKKKSPKYIFCGPKKIKNSGLRPEKKRGPKIAPKGRVLA